MKKTYLRLISAVLCVIILSGCLTVFAEESQYSQTVNNNEYYMLVEIRAKDIVYNEETDETTFMNSVEEDTNTYVLSPYTLYDDDNKQIQADIEAFTNSKSKFINICILKSKYYKYSRKDNQRIDVAAVVAVSTTSSKTDNKDKENEDKYDVLKAMNVLKGTPEGQLNLESNVTRAEMAQFIINMLCLRNASNNYVPTDNKFTDVPESHWAYNTIHFAKQIGHINGMGNDMFAPDANVTFEQAVKMIVSILGYQTLAEERGGYPHGYIQVASIIGLTENMDFANSDYATREDICDLLLSALYLPVRQQTVFGSEPEYAIMNGENGNPYIRFYDAYLDN